MKAARCHEPASDANSLELLRKLEQIVDKARACHELPSAAMRCGSCGQSGQFELPKWTEWADVTS